MQIQTTGQNRDTNCRQKYRYKQQAKVQVQTTGKIQTKGKNSGTNNRKKYR